MIGELTASAPRVRRDEAALVIDDAAVEVSDVGVAIKPIGLARPRQRTELCHAPG